MKNLDVKWPLLINIDGSMIVINKVAESRILRKICKKEIIVLRMCRNKYSFIIINI